MVGAASGYDAAAVTDLIYGAAPADDRALVELADALDRLRGAVGRPVPVGGEEHVG